MLSLCLGAAASRGELRLPFFRELAFNSNHQFFPLILNSDVIEVLPFSSRFAVSLFFYRIGLGMAFQSFCGLITAP